MSDLELVGDSESPGPARPSQLEIRLSTVRAGPAGHAGAAGDSESESESVLVLLGLAVRWVTVTARPAPGDRASATVPLARRR